MCTKTYSLKNLNKTNTLFLLITPLIAIVGTIAWLKVDGFDWRILALSLIFYIATGLGITAGYHRLFAHRSYQASWPVRLLLLIFGAAAVQNSALKWCNDHRVHHGKVDTELDPYNINEGFFYAHMGWILLLEDQNEYKYSKDLLKDPMVMFQHKFYLGFVALFSFALPALIGYLWAGSWLGGLFVAGVARIVFVHHCTFFINSLCHVVGTRPYDKGQTARDSWVMALFTYGEGYHNFHHTFQTDYRNGIKWYHFDPTKWLIRSLNFVGLTWNLKRTRPELIQARIQA
ncbi:acyl-CoA desaturase [Halobacteriovorax sp. CON-3]|uniref:acyl-CoA desaturase n=1 Tax=Halobacteriovorax sp. CON-3 TaxID=3157710 RepID=UPI003718BB56